MSRRDDVAALALAATLIARSRPPRHQRASGMAVPMSAACSIADVTGDKFPSLRGLISANPGTEIL